MLLLFRESLILILLAIVLTIIKNIYINENIRELAKKREIEMSANSKNEIDEGCGKIYVCIKKM